MWRSKDAAYTIAFTTVGAAYAGPPKWAGLHNGAPVTALNATTEPPLPVAK